ncbi:MAG TPA: tetratricopeptide repeat protein [Myxococcota bacterium]|nr:tetratricopeptide repeat protein [Myxococcota bacterium]
MSRRLWSSGWRSLLLAGVVTGPAWAQSLPEGVDPKEVDAFKEGASRYRDRMEEFRADIRSYVDFIREQEKKKVKDTYGVAVQRSEDARMGLRRVAIAKMEAFLQNYPVSKDTPEVMFRLADLYFEEADVEFASKNAEYQRLIETSDDDIPQPTKDFSRSIYFWQQLVTRYPDHALAPNAWSLLGWCYRTDNATQYKPETARDIYLEVVRRYPNTVFSDEANFQLGEFYFDQPGTKENPTAPVRVAIDYYTKVYNRGTEGRFYDAAMYKLGWAYYKLNDYAQGLGFLVRLMDYSDTLYRNTGSPSDFRPEALQYLAISYADIAERNDARLNIIPADPMGPLNVAIENLKAVGERPWGHDVVERLADVLVAQAKHDQAIPVYLYLQDHWPTHPDNPIYQYRIAEIYAGRPVEVQGTDGPMRVGGMAVRNMPASAAAMAKLSERYTEGSLWFTANRENPEAISKARSFIEDSLSAVALDYLERAGKSGQVADYVIAAEKTREFLGTFPFSAQYDEFAWYYADALFNSLEYKKALAQYQQILRNDRSTYRDGARYRIMECRRAIVDAVVRVPERPADAVVDSVVTSAAGKEVTVYKLSDEYTALIASYDDLYNRQFTNPDYISLLEQSRAAMAYFPGAILYNHGRYEEARKRLLSFITQYPKLDGALDAAGLVLETYKAEGDIDSVARYTDELINADIGSSPELIASFKASLVDVQQGALFNIAARMVDEGKYAEASAAYQAFIQQFPNSPFVDEALFNAASNLDKAGNVPAANRLFEQYIQRYPTDERSKTIYFRIAGNYSRILELQKAVEYYDAMARNFPKEADAPAALYNASFLRVGLGDHQGAARGYERYATEYPGQPDGEAVFWQAGQQWAQVSDAAALDFYQRYLRRYPASDANHVLEAWYRISSLYDKRGDSRRAAQARTELQNAFMANREVVGFEGRRYAAEAPVAELVARVEAFKKVKFTGDQKKDLEIVNVQKVEEYRTLDAAADQIATTYQDFEAGAAAYYIKGLLAFIMADLVYQMPPPKGFSEEDVATYQQLLDEKVRLPFEDKGRNWLTRGIAAAREKKAWSQWSTRSMDLLHEKFPFDYPGERPESRGLLNVADVPIAGPQGIEVAPPPEAAPPADPNAPAPVAPPPAGTPGGTP